MSEVAAPLVRLMEELEGLPGIGARTAERLAYHILNQNREDALRLARAIHEVKTTLLPCRRCHAVAEGDECRICQDERRSRGIVCVVERQKDLVAIERTGTFDGLYHVLGGRVSPAEGIGPDQLAIQTLMERISAGDPAPVEEVIIATNADAEGDTTALVVRGHLASFGVRVTRLARGLPSGGTLEHANVEIVRDAMGDRRDMA